MAQTVEREEADIGLACKRTSGRKGSKGGDQKKVGQGWSEQPTSLLVKWAMGGGSGMLWGIQGPARPDGRIEVDSGG